VDARHHLLTDELALELGDRRQDVHGTEVT
jgi:hypothetical protein